MGVLWLRGALPVVFGKASIEYWMGVHKEGGVSQCFRWQEARRFRLLLGGAITMIGMWNSLEGASYFVSGDGGTLNSTWCIYSGFKGAG